MSRVVIALLFLVFLFVLVLLFWIILLSLALFLFSKNEKKEIPLRPATKGDETGGLAGGVSDS